MTPSQFAATTILPLLARVVLCLAFFPQGLENLGVQVEFAGPEAQRLRALGVTAVDAAEVNKDNVSLGAVRGSEFDASEAFEPFAQNDRPSAPASTTPPIKPSVPPTLTTPPSPETASPQAPLRQRRLYALALDADRAGIPFPIQLAWAVSAVELVGGACVLLGMFSRLWGLLMAIIVAGVFVTTTLQQMTGKWFFDMTAANFNLVFAQMGLFVLALSVFLVGPGALSLDRAIFRRSKRGNSRKPAAKAA